MRGARGDACGGACGVDDHRRATALQPRVAHGVMALGREGNGGGGQGVFEPPLHPAPTAVKPRQPAIGMAQHPQAGRDPADCGVDLRGHRQIGGAQRQLRPGQQREDLEQVLGVAAGDRAIGADVIGAGTGQGAGRRIAMRLHSDQRKGGIEQAGQGLEPGQAFGRRPPAARQKGRLPAQRREERAVFLAVAAGCQEDRVLNPADHPAAGGIDIPARPVRHAEPVDPVKDPTLRPEPRIGVAGRGHVVEPGKAVQFPREPMRGRVDIPGLQGFHHVPGQQEISGGKLLAARKVAHGAWLGHGSKATRRRSRARSACRKVIAPPRPSRCPALLHRRIPFVPVEQGIAPSGARVIPSAHVPAKKRHVEPVHAARQILRQCAPAALGRGAAKGQSGQRHHPQIRVPGQCGDDLILALVR